MISFPILAFGQLYKCDSIYHNEDYTITGGFRNGLKHGSWDYRADNDHNKVIKYEEYWFGELVRTDTTNIYRYPMFDQKDSVIEYAFSPTVKFIIEKLLLSKPDKNYCCEIHIEENKNISLEFYHYVQTKELNLVEKFCLMTNRYIILDHNRIPVITEYDRKFAHLGWVTGLKFEIIMDSKELILEINNSW